MTYMYVARKLFHPPPNLPHPLQACLGVSICDPLHIFYFYSPLSATNTFSPVYKMYNLEVRYSGWNRSVTGDFPWVCCTVLCSGATFLTWVKTLVKFCLRWYIFDRFYMFYCFLFKSLKYMTDIMRVVKYMKAWREMFAQWNFQWKHSAADVIHPLVSRTISPLSLSSS